MRETQTLYVNLKIDQLTSRIANSGTHYYSRVSYMYSCMNELSRLSLSNYVYMLISKIKIAAIAEQYLDDVDIIINNYKVRVFFAFFKEIYSASTCEVTDLNRLNLEITFVR